MSKNIILGLAVLLSVALNSCEQSNTGPRYQAINRQQAIMLVDQESGEVFLMNLVGEKGKGITGSTWKKLGDPSMAK